MRLVRGPQPPRSVRAWARAPTARRGEAGERVVRAALADATLYHKSIVDLAPELLPLAAFALVLPCAGALAFRLLERLVRHRGELDLS